MKEYKLFPNFRFKIFNEMKNGQIPTAKARGLPCNDIRDLVKAGALIAAAIDRLESTDIGRIEYKKTNK